MERTQWQPEDHERAFDYWYEQGLSYNQISQKPNMPSYSTIKRWAEGDINCDCEFHFWRRKKAELLSQAKEVAKKELELPDRAEREKEELKFIYGTTKKIQDLIEDAVYADVETVEDVDKLETPIKLIKSLLDERRLILGEATEITEQRGSQGDRQLSLTKIAQQLNLKAGDEVTEQDLVEATEDIIVEGDDPVED